MYGVHSAHLLQVRMCDVETMSLVGYKIGYIVNFVSNPDCHLDSKWRSRNRGWWDGLKKNLGSIVSRRERLVQCSDAMGIVAIDSNVLEEE